jgi:uncharacterized protein Yka (UPF0111/DUF47 family)
MFNIAELNRKVNTLENENDILREIIKNELYKDFIMKLDEEDTIKRLKDENKRLRLKVKELQRIINDGSNKKVKK